MLLQAKTATGEKELNNGVRRMNKKTSATISEKKKKRGNKKKRSTTSHHYPSHKQSVGIRLKLWCYLCFKRTNVYMYNVFIHVNVCVCVYLATYSNKIKNHKALRPFVRLLGCLFFFILLYFFFFSYFC